MKRKIQAETILEVLVAVTILTMVLISVFALLNVSLNAQENIKNKIIATTIAQEGIEAIRNIRDTNWLKYSGDKRAKWLCVDDDLASNCPSQLSDGTWQVYYDTTDKRYYLTPYVIDGPQFWYVDFDGSPTQYRRLIEIDIQNPYDDNDGTFVTPGFCDADDPTCNQAKVKVVSRVQWIDIIDGVKIWYTPEDGTGTPLYTLDDINEVEIETFLYDFLDRNEY